MQNDLKKSSSNNISSKRKNQQLEVGRGQYTDYTRVVNQYTPLEYFCLFFSNIFELLVNVSNKYASARNKIGDITESEMKCFIGVLLLSGYTSHPRREMYWENTKDTNNILVCEAISRNYFRYIMENLHCCYNQNLN